MEKNDFLLYNEVACRIHASRTMEELRPVLLAQVKLLVPYAYATLIPVTRDPETLEAVHGEPFCVPKKFQEAEKAWLKQVDKAYTLWLSHASESVVLRDSEILAGDSRFSARSYRECYTAWGIVDCVQMNIVSGGQVMGRLALYRVRGEEVFTDQDAFYLRALSGHIGLAWENVLERGEKPPADRTLAQLSRQFGLTRREEEILDLIFRGLNNEEILDKVFISRNTLLKHLQNLYRKCGVSSRLELLKLRTG